MELTRIGVLWILTTLLYYLAECGNVLLENDGNSLNNLPRNFPSEADTLAYVDALKHSNFSQWRSLEEVAKATGGGSCSGAVNTSVLTALYLLGLFNLCAASPSSCCIPELVREDRKKRRAQGEQPFPPLLNSLTRNLSDLSLGHLRELPHVSAPNRGRVPIHISVVEQVRQLWDSNPRLLSNVPCQTAADAVRSSFISLSGVASGIILAYSIAQLNQCYPAHTHGEEKNKIWFFPIPTRHNHAQNPDKQFLVRSLPLQMPVEGEDDVGDGCERDSVRMRDGSCVRLMSSNPCPYLQWILLNRDTGQGECVPRLCPPGKVFVEADQLCHPVEEEGFCPTNQRLYLTAWGEAVCDCQDGAFPGGPDGLCHALYRRSYCYPGSVLQFHHPSRQLVCKADLCRGPNHRQRVGAVDRPQPYAQYDHNQTCYQLGSVGPCEDTERFGFDIDSLEPACVGLEEAGLARPHKSYQYSHMSFPTLQQDLVSPHFEISYVILNGNTWELEMKTVTRHKRSVGETIPHLTRSHFPEHPPRREAVVTFLDTRDFPTQMAEVLDRFRALEFAPDVKDIMKYVRKTTQTYNSPELSSVNAEVAKSGANDIRTSESIKGDAKTHDNDFNVAKLTSDSANVDKSTSAAIKVAKSIANNTKVTISTINGVKVSNSTINVVKVANSTISCAKVAKLTTQGIKVDNSTKMSSKLAKSTPGFAKVATPATVGDKVAQNNYETPKVAKNSDNIEKFTLFQKKKSKQEPMKGRRRTRYNRRRRRKKKNKEISRKGKEQRKAKRMKKGETKEAALLEGIEKKHKSKQRESIKTEKKNKNEDNKAKGNNRGGKNAPNLETKNTKEDKEEEIVFDEDFCSSVGFYPPLFQGGASDPLSKDSRGREPTGGEHPAGEEGFPRSPSRSPDVGVEEGASPNPPKGEVRSGRTGLNPERRGQRTASQGAQGAVAPSGKRGPASGRGGRRKRKRKKQPIARGSPKRPEPFGATSVGGGPGEESLPDYLRNRGRRQAGGTKWRAKLTPGIINAPLLNQCRPGAKRDYNGHCRLRVIPVGKGAPPPKKRAKSLSLQPTPPRMKCKGNERLDTRGICRATLSGLG